MASRPIYSEGCSSTSARNNTDTIEDDPRHEKSRSHSCGDKLTALWKPNGQRTNPDDATHRFKNRNNTDMNAQSTISRSDRDALLKYDRGRVKARKEDAEAYGAHLIAQFEEQLAREYSFDEDATWKAATESAEQAVKEAQRKIAGRSQSSASRDGPSLSLAILTGIADEKAPSRNAARSCAR
jgi:hypothetical protein